MAEFDDLMRTVSKFYDKNIFILAFNPKLLDNSIRAGDENYFSNFIKEEIKRTDLSSAIFIIDGLGGSLNAAVACSKLIRDSLNYYACIVPFVSASAMNYFMILSNKLYLGQKSVITQIDPMFKGYRAIKEWSNTNKEVREDAHKFTGHTIELLKKILRPKECIFHKGCFQKNGVIKERDLAAIVKKFMVKPEHSSKVRVTEIEKLPINVDYLHDTINGHSKKLIRHTQAEFFNGDSKIRGVIRTFNKDYLII